MRRLALPALLVAAAGCNLQMGTSVTRQNDSVTIRLNGEEPVVGSGKVATEDRPLTAFRRVQAESGVEVTVALTGTEAATVEADDNLLSRVSTTVSGDTLRVAVSGSLTTKNPLRVRVSAKQVEALSAASSGRITIRDVTADALKLSASSSGQVTAGGVVAKSVTVAVSSSGTVTADGRADRVEVEASSSGTFAGGKLVGRVCQVACSSSGSATVHATEAVTGSASSSGSVRYTGGPKTVDVTTSSSGSVTKADE